jgi:hypothetical protein
MGKTFWTFFQGMGRSFSDVLLKTVTFRLIGKTSCTSHDLLKAKVLTILILAIDLT